jgi:hypothetical protein
MAKTSNGLKILSLEADQIRRLSVARIQVDPEAKDPIFIVGDNDEGKSTTLDCFIWGLAGGRMPEDMIRKGADKGEIRIELGDDEPELTVRKVFKEGQPARLIVKTADGMTGTQKTLSTIVGALGMDPAALAAMSGLEQADIVQDALGIDLTDLDTTAADTFSKRTELNRRIRNAEATLEAFRIPDGTPDTEVDVVELTNDLQNALALNRANDDRRQGLIRLRDDRIPELTTTVAEKQDAIADLESRIRTLQTQKTAVQEELKTATADLERAAKSLELAKKEVLDLEDVDPSPIRQAIADANDVNEAVRAKQSRDAQTVSLGKMKEEADALTERLAAIDTAKRKRVKDADLPAGLEAIGFDDRGLTFEGFPLAELGTGKRLRVATQIALALNPKLRVILIKAGNDLDAKNLKIIADTAAEAGAQVWIERVQRPVDDGIVIEVADGHVTFGADPETGGALSNAMTMKDSDEVGADLETEIAEAQADTPKKTAKSKAGPSAADKVRQAMKEEGRLL